MKKMKKINKSISENAMDNKLTFNLKLKYNNRFVLNKTVFEYYDNLKNKNYLSIKVTHMSNAYEVYIIDDYRNKKASVLFEFSKMKAILQSDDVNIMMSIYESVIKKLKAIDILYDDKENGR